MIVGHIGGSSSGGYEIQKSLRFRASASAYLSRTPTVSGNRKTWTWSGWVKAGRTDSIRLVFGAYLNGNNTMGFLFNGERLFYDSYQTSLQGTFTTNAVFRDFSAWYHVVFLVDTTQATAANRTRLFINGVEQTFSAVTYPTQNTDLFINSANPHHIGSTNGTSNYFDGYLAEVNFIDGQALDPSYFGQVSAETGAWIPKKYTGAYGTNGFYLPFNDGSNLTNLTADRSGNGNNWTANNISLTAGSSYDWMDDTPSNNFAVLNPLSIFGTAGLPPTADGNLFFATQTPQGSIPATIFVTSGKWYAEFVATVANNATGFGVGSTQSKAAFFSDSSGGGFAYYADGRILGNAGLIASVATFTNGDVISVALDMDARSVAFYKNNTLIHTQTTGFVIEAYTFFIGDGSASAGINAVANFGQRPFVYTPPAGFKALCTANLPTPSILNPSDHFQIKLAAGASIKSTTDAVFSGQILEVIKDRVNSNNWQWMDNIRNLAGNVLQSNTTIAETGYVAPAGNSIGYAWKSGGTAVANNNGGITSQVSVNAASGFSIVTYTGSISAIGNSVSIGHGLGVKPGLIIVKNKTRATNWMVTHKDFSVANADNILLNSTAAKFSNVSSGAVFISTSKTFVVGTGNSGTWYETCFNGDQYVAYCFAEIPGFSKIGSYTGNGSADGPFVHCGFKPKFVLTKRTNTTGSWVILDAARETANPEDYALYANLSGAETLLSAGGEDFTANGFKLRGTDSNINASGSTYIFIAFAEQPFQFANAR